MNLSVFNYGTTNTNMALRSAPVGPKKVANHALFPQKLENLADDVLRIIGSMAGPTFHMLSKKCHKALQKKQLLGRQMGDMLIGGAKKGFSEAEMQRALKTRG